MLKVLKSQDDSFLNKRTIIKQLKNSLYINDISKFIREYFMRLEYHIKPDDINYIISFSQKFLVDYHIEEKYSDYQYELYISHNDHNINICQYGDRLFIDFQFDKIKYTQYQIGSYIFQIYFIDQSHQNFIMDIFKIYDLSTEKYIRGKITFDKIKTYPDYLFCRKNSSNFRILKDDVLLMISTFAKHCTYDTNLPCDFMLPLCFTFKGNRGHFDIRDEVIIFDNMGTANILNICLHGDIEITNINDRLSNFSILIRQIEFISVEIDIIAEKSSKLFVDIYKKSYDIDKHTLLKLLNDPNIRLDIFFGIQHKVHSIHIHKKDSNRLIDRKQVYHNNIVILDGSVNRYIYAANYDIENSHLWNINIYANKLNCININDIECPIPFFVPFDSLFVSQFLVSNYYKWSNSYYTRQLKIDGILITDKYTINKTNGRIRHIFDKQFETYITIYESNGKIISEYVINNSSIEMNYNYNGFNIFVKEYPNISTEKSVYLNNSLIFNGYVDNYDEYVIVDLLSDKQKEMLSYDEDEFITDVELDVQNFGHEFDDCDEFLNIESSETIIMDDNTVEFQFYYHFNDKTLGLFKWLKNVIIKRREKRQLKAMSKRSYDNNGHQKIKKDIDENNKLTVMTSNQENNDKQSQWAYKAAITDNGQQCIIKLIIPPTSKVVWSEKYDKYRVDRAIVYSISPVFNGNYVTDLKLEKCPICLDDNSIANILLNPCRHKFCGTCWTKIIKTSDNICCPYCKTDSTNYNILKLTSDSKQLSIPEALSFVHTSDFTYKIGEEIIINNFNPDLSKPCDAGIHCHLKEIDAFKWFEFLDIPDWVFNNNNDNNNSKGKEEAN